MNTNTTTETTPADIIERLIREITLHTENIKIKETTLGRSSTLNVQVHKGDMSRVIGTKGAHVQAMERLIEMMSAKSGKRMTLRVGEPSMGGADSFAKFEPQATWESSHVVELVQDISAAVFVHPAQVELFDGEDFQSVIEIVVSPNERKDLVAMVNAALAPLFNAIGKANGRLLKINAAPGGF